MHLKLTAQQKYVNYYVVLLNATSLLKMEFYFFVSLENCLKSDFTALAHVQLYVTALEIPRSDGTALGRRHGLL